MADSGFFQLNDIVLDIPPEQISVNRRSIKDVLRTLRTRSSIKIDSGYSQVDITCKVSFVGTNNGYLKLRDLVSQFRVTPFCYVQNAYLRKVILGGAASHNMALALKQIMINKADGGEQGSTDLIEVTMQFCWFNYLPFTPTFTYKKYPFSAVEVSNPADSIAWKLLYTAEQRRAKVVDNTPYKAITKLGQVSPQASLSFNEYRSLSFSQWELFKREVDGLRRLKDHLNTVGNDNDTGDVLPGVLGALVNSKGGSNTGLSNEEAGMLIEEMFGNTTSIINRIDNSNANNVLRELGDELNRTTRAGSGTRFSAIFEDDWRPVILKDGRIVDHGVQPSDNTNEKNKTGSVIITRARQINLHSESQRKDSELILSGVSISFQNVLAVLPIKSFMYPTYQHIGSIDAVVNLTFMAIDDGAIERLSEFYNIIETQAISMKHIPAGQRNLSINNDLVNMCGLKEFIPESLIVDTVPGSTNLYAASMRLLNNPITKNTQEELTTSHDYVDDQDIKRKVVKIIEDHLSIIPNIAEVKDTLGLINPIFSKVVIKQPEKVSVQVESLPGLNPNLTNDPLKNLREFRKKHPATKLEYDTSGSSTLLNTFSASLGYYRYNKSYKVEDLAFRNLCEAYGRELDKIWSNLLTSLSSNSIGTVATGDISTGDIAQFLTLNDNDVYSIQKLQRDIIPILEKHENIRRIKFTNTDDLDPSLISSQSRDTVNIKNALDVHNKLAELDKQLISSEEIEEIRLQARTTLNNIKLSDTSREIYFLNKLLDEWINFVDNFTDKILFESDLLELPQFKQLQDLITIRQLDNNVTAYPDFPLKQLVDIIEESDSTFFQEALERLVKITQQKSIRANDINSASLLGPSFYFAEPQETTTNLFPRGIINFARSTILKNQNDLRVKAENDFFDTVYKDQVLGSSINKRLEQDRSLESNNNYDKKIQDLFKDVKRNNSQSSFEPHALENNDSIGLRSSILERAEAGKNIKLKPINNLLDRAESASNKSKTPSLLYTNKRNENESRLLYHPIAKDIQHKFGADAIDFVQSQIGSDGFKKENIIFVWPTGPEARRITGAFQFNRIHPSKKDPQGRPVIRDHQGVDFAHTTIKGGSLGLPVYAVADGKITDISFSKIDKKPGVRSGDKGVFITIEHDKGYKTKYYHLQWDPVLEELSRIFWLKDLNGNSQGVEPISIKRNERIGSIGDTGTVKGAHLHFELWKNGVPLDPIKEIYQAENDKLTSINFDFDPRNESLLEKSVQQLEKDLRSGQGIGMKRAFPTYRLSFIESDLNERKRYEFDDFFSYSSVIKIEQVKSRRLAADLLMIQVTNVSGTLNNKNFRNAIEPSDKARNAKGEVGQEEEAIKSFMLKPGTQVQLKLGYENNINDLETVFNGVITDTAFNEREDIIELTCQSFGIELVQNLHGEVKSHGGFLSNDGATAEILESLMAYPEVTHFGRWTPGTKSNLGGLRSLLTERWKFTPTPADDNIFAPTVRGIWGIFDSTSEYKIYHSTLWDTMQELTLRHPGYIAYPVPYEGKWGPRMTMFFGVPNQLYFSRDPTLREQNTANQLQRFSEEAQNEATEAEILLDPSKATNANKLIEQLQSNVPKFFDDKSKDVWLDNLSKTFALKKGIIKPFRNYHILTSHQHIIANTVVNSIHNTFNTITLQYDDDGAETNEEAKTLTFDDKETFTLRCDAALPDEQVREQFAQFPNCVGYEMAKQYSLSLLKESLQEGYKGKITIIGNPSIKPHDICYIFDVFNDMIGPIAVEEVIHLFDQQLGFITEIVPDMCVHINESATIATQDALGLIAESYLSVNVPSIITEGAGIGATAIGAGTIFGALAGVGTFLSAAPLSNMFFNSSEISTGSDPTANPFKLVGTFLFKKLVTRTQLAHPMRYSPLVHHGRPMLGGLPEQLDITFTQGIEKWFKDARKGAKLLLEDTVDKYNPNSWVGHSVGNFRKTYF